MSLQLQESRRPAVSRPHNENTRYTHACDVGAESKSSARGRILLQTARLLDQKSSMLLIAPVPPASAASVRYLAICATAVSAFWPVDAKLRSWAIIFEDKKRKRVKVEDAVW